MKLKRIYATVVATAMITSLCACGEEGVSKTEYDNLQSEYKALQSDYGDLEDDYNDLKDDYNTLSESYDLLVEEYATEEETEVTAKATTEEATTAENSAYTKDMFRSDITYDNLARTPDDYEGELFTMTGEIIQVLEGDVYTDYRIAVDEYYNDIIYVQIENDILSERLLEDDNVTFYAESCNTYTYESTLGGYITIPAAFAYIIERNK